MGADEMDAGVRPKKKPSKKRPKSTTAGQKKAEAVVAAEKKPPGKAPRKPAGARTQPALGWREWVGLPDHGIDWLKAKVDTGARTSSLHAAGLHTFEVENREWVRFHVYPWQRSTADAVQVEARVLDRRQVRSSSGTTERRPVVVLPVRIGSRTVDVEFTLTRRDQMGFRMLLGRQALRRRFLVDTGRSFLLGQPPRSLRQVNRSSEVARLDAEATSGDTTGGATDG
jgi:hypothetical protein|tara:strand:- start:1279 stop:1959 length:681 start_codon:yes stop_codon:yes gene_type:complete